MRLQLAALWLCSIIGPAKLPAQWIEHRAVGIPRLADGKPDLSAPVPRGADGKPDLSGLWNRNSGQYGTDIAADLQPADVQNWVRRLYQERIDNYAKDNMGVQCVPEGPRYATRSGYMKIVHTPGLLVMLHEDLTYRQVFLDGRGLPDDPNPAWMGYSIGDWEGDTLVVTTAGFNARSWMDGTGHAHTEALRVVERITRQDYGHLAIEVTLEDPQAYNRPWTIRVTAALQPDTELIEYVCTESDPEREHMVGELKKDQERAAEVPLEVLKSYVGNYELPIDGSKVLIEIALTPAGLTINRGGRGPQPLVPLSQTRFTSSMGTFEFEPGPDGRPVLVYWQVESNVRSKRVQ